MPLSVIIPALNEATALPLLLQDLRAQQSIALDIVVVDGGSHDDTATIAQQQGARLVRSERGRGRQMNVGAAQARHNALLFLHADSRLPSPTLLADALAALPRDTAQVAGHFPLRFTDYAASATPFYRHLEGKTRLNRPYTINGDQGLLISRAFFDALGGFDETLPFLEDQRIAAKIFAQGQWQLLPGELQTSARRFETEGRRTRYTLMALIMALHVADVPEFFERAPQVYAAHHASARLHLRPFVRLIHRVLRDRGLKQTLVILWRAGGFARDNAWQLAYWRDAAQQAPSLPRLRFYDRWLRPLMRNPLAHALATLLVCLWFFAVLPLQLRRSDSIQN